MKDIDKIVEKYKADEAKLKENFMRSLAQLRDLYKRKWQNAFDASVVAEREMEIATAELEKIKNLEVK